MIENPSACRISYTDQVGRRGRSWCGSGGVVGYDETGAALILTNAHVSGSPDVASAKRIARFSIDGQNAEFDATEILAYGFSDAFAVDWAILRCPGLTEPTGVEAFPMLKTKPTGTTFSFSGSPRCVWPLTDVDISLVAGSPAAGVRFWQPPSIGGQSGSNIRREIDDDMVCQLLLTWIWNGNGAGQETAQIFNNILNANTDGVLRPEGLIEVTSGEFGHLQRGYYECAAFKSKLRSSRVDTLERVNTLPIWYDPNGAIDPPPPTDNCNEEVESLKRFLTDLRDDLTSLLE